MPRYKKPSFTKSDLIAELNKRYPDFTQAESKRMVNVIFDCIMRALTSKKRVEIRGFGSFGLKKYDARMGKNPQTGLPFEVKPKILPFFKVGKMKEAINKGSKDSHSF